MRNNGGVAQLARATGSYPVGHGFKSNLRYHPDFHVGIWPVGQAVKTRPFHGCNMGSIPVRVTTNRGDFLLGFRFALTRLCTTKKESRHAHLSVAARLSGRRPQLPSGNWSASSQALRRPQSLVKPSACGRGRNLPPRITCLYPIHIISQIFGFVKYFKRISSTPELFYFCHRLFVCPSRYALRNVVGVTPS